MPNQSGSSLYGLHLPPHSERFLTGKKFVRLNKDDAALLVVDHQVGLFQMAHDQDPVLFRNAIIAHAAIGKVFNLPTVMTTSAETGMRWLCEMPA